MLCAPQQCALVGWTVAATLPALLALLALDGNTVLCCISLCHASTLRAGLDTSVAATVCCDNLQHCSAAVAPARPGGPFACVPSGQGLTMLSAVLRGNGLAGTNLLTGRLPGHQ